MQKTLLTVEQATPQCGPDERWELVEGALIKMPPAGNLHGALAHIVSYYVTGHVLPRRLGVVLSAEAGFIVKRHPDTLRAPDVAFVAKERLEHGRPAMGFAEMAPDLVVEVVSPSDSADPVQKKTRMWLEAGVRLVLVVCTQRPRWWPPTALSRRRPCMAGAKVSTLPRCFRISLCLWRTSSTP